MADFTGGPGFLPFVFTFALALAAVLLSRSLTKHIRKVKADERRQAEEAARAAGSSDGAAGSSATDEAIEGPDGKQADATDPTEDGDDTKA